LSESFSHHLHNQPIKTMQYFSSRLKSARVMNGLSLQELSDKLDGALSKQDLSRLELGEKFPDSAVLSMLSKALNITTEYFFRSETINLSSVEFRKLTKLPKKEQEVVKGKTADFLERYSELESLMGVFQTPAFKCKEFKIANNNIDEIERAASDFREKFNLGIDPIYNLIELLEENGIRVFSTLAPPAFSGMSTCVSDSLMVVVYNDNNEIPLVRKRFTILHEVAHLFLNIDEFDEKTREKICDSFAGAVLLPKQKLFEYFGAKRKNFFTKELMSIKSYFGISIPAIMYRAKAHQIITENYHKYFMIRYNSEFKKLESEGYNGNESSQRFIQLLMRAVAEEIVSTSKAASLNNQKLWEFRKQFIDVDSYM